MIIEFWKWASSTTGLTLGQLGNVQTVGVGLYLALGVIQSISTTGTAGLARRIGTLRAAVTGAKMQSEIANVRRLSGEVSGLEIGFHDLNRRVLWLVLALFMGTLIYFAWSTINQNDVATQIGLVLIFFCYLALPVILFLLVSAVIWNRCRLIASQVGEAEVRIRTHLLGL